MVTDDRVRRLDDPGPGMRLPDLEHSEVAIVRARIGVDVDVDDEFLGPHASEEPVHAFFFLVTKHTMIRR